MKAQLLKRILNNGTQVYLVHDLELQTYQNSRNYEQRTDLK